MYLQRGPPIAENKPTTHRTHRMHRTLLVFHDAIDWCKPSLNFEASITAPSLHQHHGTNPTLYFSWNHSLTNSWFLSSNLSTLTFSISCCVTPANLCASCPPNMPPLASLQYIVKSFSYVWFIYEFWNVICLLEGVVMYVLTDVSIFFFPRYECWETRCVISFCLNRVLHLFVYIE